MSLKLNLQIGDTEKDIFSKADSLLCLIHSNTLGFVLYHHAKKTVYCWKVWEIENDQDVHAIIDQESMHLPDNLFVKILNYSPRYQAIPSLFTISDKHLGFWDVSMGYQPDEKILEDRSAHSDICFLHSIRKTLYDEINQRFPHAHWYPIQAIQFMHPIHQSDKASVRLIFYYNYIHIDLFHKGEILLSKAYSLNSPEDVLWHLLNIINGLGFTKEQVCIHPEGFIDTNSSLFQLLDQYFERTTLPNQFEYQFPASDIELGNLTLVHIDRILSCVS